MHFVNTTTVGIVKRPDRQVAIANHHEKGPFIRNGTIRPIPEGAHWTTVDGPLLRRFGCVIQTSQTLSVIQLKSQQNIQVKPEAVSRNRRVYVRSSSSVVHRRP